MKEIIWNEKTYQIFIDDLYKKRDLKYRDFISKIGVNNQEIIGIRIPELKKIAKNISKSDYQAFIKYNKHQTLEEKLLHGLLIGNIKEEFKDILKLFSNYITYIDNWSLCDTTVANMHIWRHNLDEGLIFITNLLKQNNPWKKRVGYVLLLDYYIDQKYLKTIFQLCDLYNTKHYYVQMAIAWLISICYIKYPNETLTYIKNNKLDTWTHNKAIQKIKESLRIDDSTKKYLNTLKRTS